MKMPTDQERARRQKLQLLRSEHVDPYPARIGDVERIASVREAFRNDRAAAIAGRVRALRLQGGSMFVDLDDGTAKLQCFFSADSLGDVYDRLTKTLDLGDFLKVEGTLFTTKRGEQTLKASAASMIAKAFRPLPDKRHGLADVELRFRHRELDLIANPGTMKVFETRGNIINAFRDYLVKEGYLEVETPILQAIPGGATARPFVTHHNSLNTDLYLRIAPELYLKRLIIGGFQKVFEIARCFRNEGLDFSHNPEFTQIELYAAYMDYLGMMDVTERMLHHVLKSVIGANEFPYDKATLRFPDHLQRITFRDAVLEHAKIDINEYADTASLYKKVKAMDLDVTAQDHRPKILDELFKTFVRPKLIQPVFIIDHPVELSPLAKKKVDDPRYVERFQLLVAGAELCNAFSELNDPDDQRARFEQQEKFRRAGDAEAQPLDEEFLEALEYGMPPTAGLGIGIDRLTMLLTNNRSIKEVIAFPTLRQKP